MLMSRRPGLATSTTRLLVVIAFLLAVAAAAAPPSPRQFSTVAISHTRNSTLVCALIIDRVNEDGGGNSKLQCKSMPDGRLTSYPSADIPFNAIAAGKDFLCGLMAPVGGHAAMRWWSFTEEEEARRSRPVGRRIYWGPSLRSMSAGGPHVCGLSDDHDPTCWEWPGLDLPKGLDFSLIALGQDFLCGIVKGDDTAMRCYGGAMPSTPQFTADGVDVTFQTVAAGRRHACAVDKLGGLVCWGDGNPTVRLDELPADMMAMALGRNTTCILAGNGTVRCWGVKVPEEYTHTTFVSIEADGDTVCAVMTSNYSVVCWGNDGRFDGRHLVYNNTMPGACAPKSNCSCNIVPDSGRLCGTGGGLGGEELAVCSPCKQPLNASRIVVSNGSTARLGDGAGDAKKKKTLFVGLGVASAGVLVIIVAGLTFYVLASRKSEKKAHATVRLGESSSRRLCRDGDVEIMVMPARERSASQPARPLGCEEFTLKDLSRLTNAFAEEAKIGSGSFGSVYRAKLPDGREVAIKRAERASTGARRRRRFDAERAFRSELRLLSRVNHRNLVSLLGFCEERGERILVFEFMPHGALHDHLHGEDAGSGHSPLFSSWEARLRVALDAARGVEYLHCYAVPPIIHRDIKPSNILLDDDWTAKVSDFGLSLVSGASASASPTTTSGTAGTVGYMDPEYYRLQELTERSDVYSFGVVLLELVTGRKAIHRDQSQEGSGSPRNVIEFAVPAVEAGNIDKILDSRVPAPRGHEVEAVARVAKIGAECVRPRGRGRPVMSEVVAELEWAVTLCEECVVRSASGGRNSSSRNGGSDMSRSRSRSESEDRSPYHTREFSFGFGRVAGVGHARKKYSEKSEQVLIILQEMDASMGLL
ncbi:unnamed protein product [Triticum turgidum subsp. durum]|uniref:Protein kinase domain-containing protein n=1 Tax=Triticum turgidum subsp. durum TaxID=4567 RepID=A0A9R1BPJ5_TRITD|nr:unnamed protein product [Triticum turgidum subsp. durum]